MDTEVKNKTLGQIVKETDFGLACQCADIIGSSINKWYSNIIQSLLGRKAPKKPSTFEIEPDNEDLVKKVLDIGVGLLDYNQREDYGNDQRLETYSTILRAVRLSNQSPEDQVKVTRKILEHIQCDTGLSSAYKDHQLKEAFVVPSFVSNVLKRLVEEYNKESFKDKLDTALDYLAGKLEEKSRFNPNAGNISYEDAFPSEQPSQSKKDEVPGYKNVTVGYITGIIRKTAGGKLKGKGGKPLTAIDLLRGEVGLPNSMTSRHIKAGDKLKITLFYDRGQVVLDYKRPSDVPFDFMMRLKSEISSNSGGKGTNTRAIETSLIHYCNRK